MLLSEMMGKSMSLTMQKKSKRSETLVFPLGPLAWRCVMPFLGAPCPFPVRHAFFLYKNGPFSWCESLFSFVTSRSPRFLSVLINMRPDYVRNLHLFTDRTGYSANHAYCRRPGPVTC